MAAESAVPMLPSTRPMPTPTASSQATRCSLRHTSTNRDGPNSPTATSPRPSPSTRQHAENLDHALQLPRPTPLLTPGTSPLYPAHLDHDFPLSSTKLPSKSLLDSCRPLVHRATTCAAHLSSSPPKSLASFIPSRRAPEQSLDHSAAAKSSSLFADWFNGPSVSFQIGFSSSSDEDSESDIGSDSDLGLEDLDTTIMDSGSSYTRAPPKARTSMASNRQSTVSVNSTQSAASKQNFFTSLFSRGPATHKLDPNQPQDLLSVMNIDEALFPNGQLDPQDPASYPTLLTSSKALLEQFQASYKALHFAMQDTRLEEDAMMEEKKEAEARAKHLQIQLDAFKFDLEKRDKEIHSLREQLEAERQMQQQDEARASRSPVNCKCEKRQSAASNLTGAAESVISDRDSGFESESETIAVEDGAFSRPASMVSDADEIDLCPTPTSTAGPTSAPPAAAAAAPRPGHMKRKSTFDKNLVQKRQSKQGAPSPPMRANQPIVLSGGKIRVNDAASGHQHVDLWRENHVLRERVTELEKVVDETLGIVGGLEASNVC
ncbi:uncharacterized protein J3D65DRAFT_117132 [Phyllosticta citribraziliensis]|uniref:Uncharacterized protein n=1 Tax=Phyllosticta citribraziliensis TaxID=989973 RepID=A0ABR1L8E1_9PEZI